MRVVLDTNIFISALNFGGKPGILLEMALTQVFTLVVSEEILDELQRVLRVRFDSDRGAVAAALGDIRKAAMLVTPRLTFSDCQDPDDNRILEAAVEADADLIVSGDKHLLRMKRFRGIDILTASEFLLRLGV